MLTAEDAKDAEKIGVKLSVPCFLSGEDYAL